MSIPDPRTPSTLAALAEVLSSRGWAQAAELPLAQFVEVLNASVRARSYLQQLVTAGSCPKVLGLLEQPLLANQIRHQFGLAGEQQVAVSLAAWFERRSMGLKGQALAVGRAAPVVAANPKKPSAEAEPTGAGAGLQPGLSRKALGEWVGKHPWRQLAVDLTLRDLALPAGTQLAAKGYVPDYTRLGDLLCDFAGRSTYALASPRVLEIAAKLLAEAEQAPEQAAASEAWRLARPAPADPELANLQHKLLELRARVRPSAEPRPPKLARQRVAEVVPDERRITIADPDAARFCPHHYYGGISLVYVEATGQFQPSLTPCRGNCAPTLAAIDVALDAVQAPSAPLRKLAHAITVPAWALLFEQVDSMVAAHEKTADRAEREALGWRVDMGEGTLELEPVWVSADRKGQVKLKKAALSGLRGDPTLCTTDADRRLLELPITRREVRLLSEQAAFKAVGTVLRALAGHPRLFQPNDQPLTVAQATLRLQLQPVAGGAQWHVAMGEATSLLQTVTASLQDGAEDVVLEQRGAIEVAPLSAVVRRLLVALQTQPILPGAAIPALLQRLPQLVRLLPVEVPEALRGAKVSADLRPVLRLEVLPDGALQVDARVRPLPDSPLLIAGEGGAEVHGQQGETRVWAERDLAAERAARTLLWATLALPGEPPEAQLPLEAGLELTERLEALEEGEAVVLWSRERRQTRRADTHHLRVEVRDRPDWFGVGGTLQVGDAQVDLQGVLQAIRERRKFVQVSGNLWLQLSDVLRQRLERAADAVAKDRSGLVLSPLQADVLDGLVEGEIPQRWQLAMQAMRSASQAPVAVPGELQATLRGYQQDGVHWLLRLAQWAPGAVLADDMGLGKTLQALAVLLDRRARGPALVVAPTSVEANWLREAATFAPALRCTALRQTGKKAKIAPQAGDVVVVSYDLLVRNAAALSEVHWATLVCDEAQAIKNSTTQRFKAVMGLEADFRLGLTGTPVENHTGELWAVLTALVPGLLGPWAMFQERFAGPIERDGDAGARAALARVLRPFVLRRLKAQVAQDLPPRTEVRVDIEPSAEERELYQQVRLAALQELQAQSEVEPQNKRFAVLAAITRLRQVACHPRLLDDASAIPSAKLAHVLDLLDELRQEGHRALVFSQFVRHLSLLREQLDKAKISYRYLDGSTPEPQRRKEVAAFQAGQGDVFLISLKAGGTGLNLTGADYVLHLDPWWNPAVEDQATDRAHRIGQLRPVTVYRLVTTGTIEEAILTLHDRKRELVAGLLEGTGESAQLSTEQLVDLLREATVTA